MKKSNIFLCAYIAFISVSFIVRIFCNYPMWSELVVAITIASSLFTIADVCNLLYSSAKERIDTYKPFLKEALERRKKIQQKFDIIVKGTELTNNNGIESFNNMMDLEENILERIQKNLNYTDFWRKVYKVLIIGCTFIGFFGFFCTMTFKEFSGYVIKLQDYISIVSFILILVAQQYSAFATDKLKKEATLFEEANKNMKKIEQLFCELGGNYAD